MTENETPIENDAPDETTEQTSAGPLGSPYFGSVRALVGMSGPEAVHAMTGMLTNAYGHLQQTLDYLADKPDIPEDLWLAFLRDLDAWNVTIFANLGVNIPSRYYDTMYGIFRAATYRAIQWQKPEE